MNGRRDLCAKYVAVVPNGLRDRDNLELARVLAAIKGGQSPDAADAFFGTRPRTTSRGWVPNREPLPMNGPHGRLRHGAVPSALTRLPEPRAQTALCYRTG
jgi:hypothetical protein